MCSVFTMLVDDIQKIFRQYCKPIELCLILSYFFRLNQEQPVQQNATNQQQSVAVSPTTRWMMGQERWENVDFRPSKVCHSTVRLELSTIQNENAYASETLHIHRLIPLYTIKKCHFVPIRYIYVILLQQYGTIFVNVKL